MIDFDDFEDSDFWQPSLVADKPLFSLPETTTDEIWYCQQCGENCKPKFHKNIYSRTINMTTGEGTEKFEQFYVSPCCLGNLGIYFKSTNKDQKISEHHFKPISSDEDKFIEAALVAAEYVT